MKKINFNHLNIYLIKFFLALIVTLVMMIKLNLTQHWFWLAVLISGLTFGLLFTWLDERFFYQLYVRYVQLKGLLSQSLIFLALFVPLAFFIVTSSSSPLGIGFVLGFLISTSVDLLVNLSQPGKFQQEYLYQFAREFAPDEQRLIAFAFTGVTLLVGLLALV
jgi:hypothetical protein